MATLAPEAEKIRSAIIRDLEQALRTRSPFDQTFPTLDTIKKMPSVKTVLTGGNESYFRRTIDYMLGEGSLIRHPTHDKIYMYGGIDEILGECRRQATLDHDD